MPEAQRIIRNGCLEIETGILRKFLLVNWLSSTRLRALHTGTGHSAGLGYSLSRGWRLEWRRLLRHAL